MASSDFAFANDIRAAAALLELAACFPNRLQHFVATLLSNTVIQNGQQRFLLIQ